MAQVAKTPDDAAARYVLACEARDLGAELGDLALVTQAAEIMGGEFDLDQQLMLAEIYRDLLPKTRLSDANRALAESAVKVLDRALAVSQFEAAEILAKVAVSAAGKAKDTAFSKTVKAKSDEVAAHKHASEEAERAATKLAESPDDAEPHLLLGKYLCFYRGDWQQGLPHLSRGSDATLKDLATKSLATPNVALSLAELGDAWWDAAENAKGKDKEALQSGAHLWYSQALPGLAGLNKVKAQKRLGELGEPKTVAKGPIGRIPASSNVVPAKANNSGPPRTASTPKAVSAPPTK